MRIVLNGESCEIVASTLDQVLLERGYEDFCVATAVNGTFVHKQQRAETELKEGDRVEVVAPIQGG